MRVMRGTARVESSPGGGARIVLSLPVLDDDDGGLE
jgi:signal transduction histidine kinase